MAFDSGGSYYVADTGFPYTIEKFNSSGTGSTLASANALSGPIGLAFDNTDNLYVANNTNNTILKFTSAGVVSTFASSNITAPYFIAFQPNLTALAGDYNGNRVVDAADYVVWRANQGTSNVLANDPIGGAIGAAQYNQWRAHFGQTVGSGTGAVMNAGVPEPATFVLLMFAVAVAAFCEAGLHKKSQQLGYG